MPMQHPRSIGKAMHLFKAEHSPIEADEQHTSTTCTQVDCGHIACLHHLSPYRGYAAATPPSTLRMLPVLLVERVGEAKNATASAMSSGRILTPSVVRLRYTSSSWSGATPYVAARSCRQELPQIREPARTASGLTVL